MTKFGSSILYGSGRLYGVDPGAYCKIVYEPSASFALQLDGGSFLYTAETSLNPGIGDFACDALVYIDPWFVDTECLLAGQGLVDLSNEVGWHWYYKPASRRLGLRINNGGAEPLEVETEDYILPAPGTWCWLRLAADRDSLASFQINGVEVGSGSISAKSGSLENSEPFRIGGQSATVNRHKGMIGFLRMDMGRLLPAWWLRKEWLSIVFGLPREVMDFKARWNFAGSLTDSSAAGIELIHSGTPEYLSGWPSASGNIDFTFPRNFSYGHKIGYLDLDARDRGWLGNARSYAGGRKKSFILDFKGFGLEQLYALQGAALTQPFTFYPAADGPECIMARFNPPPEFLSIPYFENGDHVWELPGVVIEEV